MKNEKISVHVSPLVGEKTKLCAIFKPRPLVGEVISYFILQPSLHIPTAKTATLTGDYWADLASLNR